LRVVRGSTSSAAAVERMTDILTLHVVYASH